MTDRFISRQWLESLLNQYKNIRCWNSDVVDRDTVIRVIEVLENEIKHAPNISIGCADEDRIVGVAIVGRPVARHLDDGWTLEVNRLCTDGTKNACSMLYAAAWRAARAMGYKKLVTYTIELNNDYFRDAVGYLKEFEDNDADAVTMFDLLWVSV